MNIFLNIGLTVYHCLCHHNCSYPFSKQCRSCLSVTLMHPVELHDELLRDWHLRSYFILITIYISAGMFLCACVRGMIQIKTNINSIQWQKSIEKLFFITTTKMYYYYVILSNTREIGELTGVLKVDVIPIVRILQLVGHDTQSHDLLPDQCVGPGDIDIHLWVVHLVG